MRRTDIMGVTFEDYDNLLARCEQVKDLDKEIGEIKKSGIG